MREVEVAAALCLIYLAKQIEAAAATDEEWQQQEAEEGVEARGIGDVVSKVPWLLPLPLLQRRIAIATAEAAATTCTDCAIFALLDLICFLVCFVFYCFDLL